MRTYTVTYAMPGYLPDGCEPVFFPSYRKARAYVMEMARANETRVTPRGVTGRGRVVSWNESSSAHVWEVYGEQVTPPGTRDEYSRYIRYTARCRWESCDPHSFKMWRVQGKPAGPI